MNEEKRIKKIVEEKCKKDEESGECKINTSFSDIKENSNNILNFNNNEIDNEMINNIKNDITNENNNSSHNLFSSHNLNSVSKNIIYDKTTLFQV